MSKSLRAATACDVTVINVQHQFVVKLSPIDSHLNHYIAQVLQQASLLRLLTVLN